MAFNIKPLRQQNIFGNFSLGNLMDNSGYDYGNEDQDVSQRTYQPSPSDMFTSGPDLESLGGQNVNLGKPPTMDPRGDSTLEKSKRLIDIANQAYTPSTIDRDRNRNLLDNPPERNDPSFMRRLVAAGVGLGNTERNIPGGIGEQEKVLYAPYMREMADWTAKSAPFGQAAQQENSANNIERQLAGNVVSGVVNQERIESQERTAAEKNRIQEDKNKAAAESARITAYARQYAAQLGRGYEFDLSGPTIKVMNRNTGSVIDTGRETGKLSEEDKIDLLNYGKIEAARQQGVNAATIAGINNAEMYQDDAGNRYGWDATNGTIKPMGNAPTNPIGDLHKIANPVTPKIMSPGDTEKARQNTLDGLYNSNEYFKQFIEYDADAKTYKLKDTAPPDLKSKVYPELYPPKKDINLPLEPGQQREDRTTPPSTGGITGAGAGGITGGQPQTGMPIGEQQAAGRQQQADIQAGKALKIYRVGQGGNVENGVIPNTPESIADARRLGWTVVVGGGGR